MRYLYVVEVLDGERHCYPEGAKWSAWDGQSFETRERARNAQKYHKESCWTRTRIVKYVPEKP